MSCSFENPFCFGDSTHSITSICMGPVVIPVHSKKLSLNRCTTGFRAGGLFADVCVLGLFVLTLVVSGCEQSSPGAKQKKRDERWAKGRVFAEVRVLESPKKIIFTEQDRGFKFAVYRQAQMRLMTGPFVLQSALRKPEIANLGLLKDQEKPLEWLEQNLVVDNPATEFIRISLKSKQRADAAQIVNAVVNAYVEEAADQELGHRQKRRRELEKALEDLQQKLKVKSARIKRIAEEVGAVNLGSGSSAEQAALEFRELAAHELAREEFARAKEQVQLAVLQASANTANGDTSAGNEPSSASDVAWLNASIDEHSIRIHEWKRILESFPSNRRTTAIQSLELTSLQKELEADQPIMQQLRDELTRLDLDPEAGGRISLFRKATADEAP